MRSLLTQRPCSRKISLVRTSRAAYRGKMKAALSILLGALILSPFASAAEFHELSAPVLEAAARMGLANKPISELPHSLEPQAAGIILYADYEHIANGRIPVYLINRTGEPILLNAQDGDIYLKLEFQDADGGWKRAQLHQMSGCGNSYDFHPPLRSGQFITLSGYQPKPKDGRAAKIRFRLYRQKFEVVSNVGEGLIASQDVAAAQRDEFVVVGAGFDYVAAIAQGKAPVPNIARRDTARELAIFELVTRGFDKVKAKEVLDAIVASGEEPFAKYALEKQKWIEQLPDYLRP